MKSCRFLAAFSITLLITLLVTACGDNTPTAIPSPATTTSTNTTAAATTVATTIANPTSAVTTTATSTNVSTTGIPATVTTPAVPTTRPTSTVTTTLFTYGVASGDMTSNSAVLWTRTTGPATVTAEVAETENFENPLSLPPTLTSETNDFTLHLAASGLKPGTKYYYRFKARNETSPTGSFKTAYAADQNAPVTMGFTGDADWKWKPYPLLNNLVKEKLDFFFFLGDLIYETTNLPGTTVAETLQDYRAKYRENREPRPNSDSKAVPMLDLYRLFGQYSVFDNHETGPSKTDKNAPPYNEGGAQVNGQYVNQSEGFKARIQAYREYQPVREEEVTGTADPRSDQTEKFYRAIPWGANVELIVLDDRSYRDIRLASSDDPKATSCDRTMLGAPQFKWLQDELLSTKQRRITWKVVVISSPIQQLGKASQIGGDLDGTKSWAGGYSCERNKLLKFIDDNEISNVIFLTTDNHYTVINNLKYNSTPDDPKSTLKPARNAFEILTGPIGASAGNPIGLKVDTKGLSIREADRKILAVWNGDIANSDGQTKGLKQAGLDPIGLEADFPGLQAPSIKATGAQAGTVEPLDFASFNTYSYAVLAFTKDSLKVQVKGFPIVPDPATLQNSEAEKEYESRQAEEILSFEVLSQPEP